jgi:hypothetical protein
MKMTKLNLNYYSASEAPTFLTLPLYATNSRIGGDGMKKTFGNKKVIIVILALIVLSFMSIVFFAHNYYIRNADDTDKSDEGDEGDEEGAELPVGKFEKYVYENYYAFVYDDERATRLHIMETTREIPLELVHQFEIEQKPELYEDSYTEVFYDVMSVETLNKWFDIDFETEEKWVAISYGLVIGHLVYDANWVVGGQYQKDFPSIGIPVYERAFSPDTVYVYTSEFLSSRNGIYTGFWHWFFSLENRGRQYVDYYDWEGLDVQMWSEDNPSPKLYR